MKKTQASAVLALGIAVVTPFRAQAQAFASPFVPPVHLAQDAMSASDAATLQAHQSDLVQAARIYGYNLAEGNWAYEQTLCGAMPGTILLHYLQMFPDGTSSLFTALVPRQSGRVHIVPVLHRNAAPFVPPAKNPRNYALFNELVSSEIASKAVAPGGNGLELSVCYAELVGGRTNVPQGSGIRVPIAGAPLATISANPKDNVVRVTFASQQGDSTYRVWSVTFSKTGRVIGADSEDHTVFAPKASPQRPSAVATTTEQSDQGQQAKEQTPQPGVPVQGAPADARSKTDDENQQVAASMAPTSVVSKDHPAEQPSEPGWKQMPHPAEPAATVIAPAPPPPEKTIPMPPDPEDQAAQ
jgi:hypothetical protein